MDRGGMAKVARLSAVQAESGTTEGDGARDTPMADACEDAEVTMVD